MPHIIDNHWRLFRIGLLIMAMWLLIACGGQQSGDDASSAAGAAPVVPTMPSGQFKAVGEQNVITSTTALTTTAQTTQTAASAAATADLARGEAAYVKNKCGDCHGAAGEGVTDKGNALIDMTLSFEEFDKLLRTGGGLGNTHIFGRSAVSPSGMEALYAYTQAFE